MVGYLKMMVMILHQDDSDVCYDHLNHEASFHLSPVFDNRIHHVMMNRCILMMASDNYHPVDVL